MSGSDFLSGLLDRATDRAPLIERRTASIFEPIRVGPARPAAGDHEIEFTQPERSPAPARRPDVEIRDTQSRGETQQVALPGERIEQISRAVNPAVQQQPPRAAMHPILTIPIAELPRPVASVAEIHNEIHNELRSEIREDDGTGAKIAAPARPAELHANPESARVENRRPRHDETPVAGMPHARPQAFLAEPRAQPVLVTPRSAAQPSAYRRGVPMRSPQPAIPAVAAAPAIEVTIGRIEIRTTSPTQQARPARQNRPKLDLDGYLKSRAEGGR